MLAPTGHARDAGIRIVDLAALTLALPLAHEAHGLFIRADRPDAPLDAYWIPLAAMLLAWIGSAWAYRVYETTTRPLHREVGQLLRALVAAALFAGVVTFFVKVGGLSRFTAGGYVLVAAALLVATRVGGRALRLAPRQPRYYALVGTGEHADEIVNEIETHPEWGLSLAGCVLEDGASADPDYVILGRLSDLGRILEEHVLDEVVFAVPRERLQTIEKAILTCEELGVEVRLSLDAFRFGQARMSVATLGDLPMLTFTRTPADRVALALKRGFDVAASAAALLLLSPLLLAAAVAIKVDSPGPVFFRQRRVGLHGRVFSILKFRSMHRDAEARQEALRAQNEMSGPVFKMTNDPRITRVGRLLRRTSIDELPQFWNVLVGEMSVVGPRPPIPSEVAQYKRWHRRRLSVRPGITCVWQISGRNQIDFERWMELDLEYIDHWSLWGDLQIVAKTIPAVLSARGAQ
jgi:exopolysaccharide biosynthesis polyprenyl glycosylphosphotransferase